MRLLGRGGMGMVFEAEDRELGISVALKTLPPKTRRSAEALRKAIREARGSGPEGV